jgi:serine/threonine-protein kinase HipA
MMTTSKPLYVYLQRPDNGDWVTVGRYILDPAARSGRFRYAESYAAAGFSWSIDPVNLPFATGTDFMAQRYGGLHDILRDACPDAWGKMLLQREHGLPQDAHASRYLLLAGNAERWGALAIGLSKTPALANLASPRLPLLEILARELLAIATRQPPVDARLRKRLVTTASMGGARPKATVRDEEKFWLVKPYLPTDTVDIPLLEHVTQQWGKKSGLDFADTVHHKLSDGLSVVRVLRFDREGDRRYMAISAASLLQTEYPGATEIARWSYPRLADELRRIGAPSSDRQELFGRMAFNAIAGNDDDHPRNHAVIYRHAESRWRLAPAFDVVPNPDATPVRLTMQLAPGRTDIARETLLADAVRFGFASREAAGNHLDSLMLRMKNAFQQVAPMLNGELHRIMSDRVKANLQKLAGPAA